MSIKTRHGTCSCCGREITSSEEGYYFSWFCDGEVKTPPCLNYGRFDHCDSCKLDVDDELVTGRKRSWEFIRSRVFSIVSNHGFCVTNSETEVLRALADEIKLGSLKCYPIKEGDEMIAFRFCV